MYLDAQTQLSNSQAATAGATSVSTNSYDMGDVTPKRRLDGEPMALVFFIEAITGTADTFTLDLIQATDDALTTAVDVILTSGVKAAAALPAGSVFVLPIPPGFPTKRFVGAQFTLGAADALTVSAFLVPMSFIHKLQDYATKIVIA